ncbi:MAG: hypothetical protein EOS54_16310 [Mesorhizobium sp.]|nr:MAG: hypothetical protein EOS54_16310 [Mesorhizobium sp.]
MRVVLRGSPFSPCGRRCRRRPTAWRKPSSRSPTPHSVQDPSSGSALRADPPSPTRGEGEARA